MDIETGIMNEQPNEEIIETEPTEDNIETPAADPSRKEEEKHEDLG